VYPSLSSQAWIVFFAFTFCGRLPPLLVVGVGMRVLLAGGLLRLTVVVVVLHMQQSPSSSSLLSSTAKNFLIVGDSGQSSLASGGHRNCRKSGA
jgi:hypothetical protein